MPAAALPQIASFRRQQLLLDFVILKDKFPDAVYISLTPGDPSLWSGVLFVRNGPHASAVLRFQISFPLEYPELPPLITFSTDLFHPLLVPLTTYTFSSGSLDASGNFDVSDEERLPPGAFSLRHGFPHWFGRGRRSQSESRNTSNGSGVTPQGDTSLTLGNVEPAANIIQVLEYVKSAFDDTTILDHLPLEFAGNPGAWHAWRAYRSLAPSRPASPIPAQSGNLVSKHPGEWNWDGVWESRVKHGIESSMGDVVLFRRGNPQAPETIRFLSMDEEAFENARTEMLGLT